MSYFSSAVETKDKIKDKIPGILKDTDITGDTFVLTWGDGLMMKSWLDDLFAGKIQIDNCDICAIIGTSAVIYDISINELYYIFVKGHPRLFLELVQLIGRLKSGNGKRVMKYNFIFCFRYLTLRLYYILLFLTKTLQREADS